MSRFTRTCLIALALGQLLFGLDATGHSVDVERPRWFAARVAGFLGLP